MRGLLVLFAVASVCSGAEWDAFKVSWNTKSELGYHDMPWTVKEAVDQKKWSKIDEDKKLNVDVYAQHEDPRVLLLFDKNGIIAGIRMSLIKEDISKKALSAGLKFEIDYDNNPMYEKGNYFGKDLWHSTVLFVNPTKLTSGGRTSLDKTVDEIAEDIYFKPEDKWVKISKEECKPETDFVESKCFPGMGKHYFYKIDQPDCKLRKPFFVLYDEGKLSGFGLAGYGSFTKHPETVNYFEELPAKALNSAVPDSPACIRENIDKYGITIMHVFLKKDASKTTCPKQEWRSLNC